MRQQQQQLENGSGNRSRQGSQMRSPNLEQNLRYGSEAPLPLNVATAPPTPARFSQPWLPSTSGFAAGTPMPGYPNGESPLARFLRETATRPNGAGRTAAPPASPTPGRAPVRFAEPLAALAALVRLSAMRDGPG